MLSEIWRGLVRAFRIICFAFWHFASMLFISTYAYASCGEHFCVGLVLPLSGPVGEYGVAIRNGVTMAEADSPASFRDIRFLYEDSEYKPAKSVSSFKKLALVDKVDLLYTFGGSVSEVVAPVGQQLKAATLISSVDPSAKIGNSYVLRFSNPARDFGMVLAEELKRIEVKRIGIVLTENHYLNALVRALRESIAPHQEIIDFGTFQPSEADFKTTVTRLAENPPEAIGIFLLPGQVSQFYREMGVQKINLPTFGSDVFDSVSEVKAAQGQMDGAFLAHHVVSDAFRSDYVRRFGNDYQLAAAGQGYDLANLVAKLYNATDTELTSEQVLDRLRTAKPFRGVTGEISFVTTKAGDEYFQFRVELKRIVGQQIVIVETENK